MPADNDRRALARALVAEFAPEELLEFDLMTKVYFASPRAARRARKPRDEPGGLTPDLGNPTATNLVWSIIGGLTTEAVIVGLKLSGSRLSKVFGRRNESGPDSPLPDVPTRQEVEARRERLIQPFDGDLRAQVEIMTDRAIDRWGRRDWIPPA